MVPCLVGLAVVVGIIGVAVETAHLVLPRVERSHRVAAARSELDLALTIAYDRGPISREEYRLRDLDGLSQATYRIRNRRGKMVTIELVPQEMRDVVFLFEAVERDGLWQVTDRPPRGDRSARYVLWARQEIGGAQGSRTVRFTDPRYWATTAGRSYHLRLDPHRAVPDLLTLHATQAVDPRYERIVEAIRHFGPADFRARIAEARTLLGDQSPAPGVAKEHA